MQRLQPEVQLIADSKIREFIEYLLLKAPSYFWEVPSSSSGKYHPEQSNGEGGLVRHTKAVVYFATKLCDVYSVVGIEKDCILAACILHDIVKYGEVRQSHTTKNHDYEGAMFVMRHGQDVGLDKESLAVIAGCVAWHMGRWTDMTGRNKAQSFPDDYTKPQMIIHLADVISAQKNVSLCHI